jgi:ubiquitin carboxyl-terminal hydrolase 5/13
VVRSFLGESLVEDFYSPAISAKTVAKKSARLKTFPDYLLLSLSKYQMDKNWQPIKLNVQVSGCCVPQLKKTVSRYRTMA